MTAKTFLGEFEQMVLLAILQCGSQAFALEVRREIEQRAGREVSRGAFYTTLDRLERKRMLRWVEATPEDPRTGGSLRRYSVTPDGVAALRVSRDALTSLWRGLGGVLDRG
jgi:DNA-binding PadR family transcriptional regulator